MNLIHQKIKQKERAASAFALVALDCGLPREELLGAFLHLALPRIGIRGVNLGEDSEWELFENPLATALIDPAIVVRRAPPHLANFHRRALRLLASLPLGFRASEEIINAIVVGCGENATHHDIEVAVSADEDEAHARFPRLFAKARSLLLVHEVGIKNDVAALLHNFDGRVLGDCARFLVAFALFAKFNTNVIALDDRRTDVLGKLMRHRTLTRTNEANNGNDDRLIGLALLDVELRHEYILRGSLLLGECFAFVNHNSNYTRQNELCQSSEHLAPPFFGLFSTGKVAIHHLSFCRYDSIKIVSRQALGPIPHTSQEWQSSLIGIDRATKIRAFQNQVCASSPITALDFNESHAAMSDKAPTPHRPFQSRHLKCFLFIKMWVSKIRFIDLLLFYHMIKKFSFPQNQNMVRADVFNIYYLLENCNFLSLLYQARTYFQNK